MEKISFDLNLCECRDMDSEKAMYAFCEQIAERMGLELFIKPTIIPYFYGIIKLDDGISCKCLFKEKSGIGFFTVHTFVHRKTIYFDLISNEKVDKIKTLDVLKNLFKPKEVLEGFSYDGTQTWGVELWGDVQSRKILSFDALYDLTSDIIHDIEMTKISNTMIERNKDSIIAISLIAESHIAFIYNEKTKRLTVDIFSCKFFDKKIVEKLVEKYCKCKFVYNVISRGLKHNGYVFQ